MGGTETERERETDRQRERERERILLQRYLGEYLSKNPSKISTEPWHNSPSTDH